ncbi:Histone acetyltransferase, partial [Trichostrongylus colubriformis]
SGNYPAEYSGLKTIYICDGCFSYFGHEPSQIRHMSKCAYRFAPPGDEIYHDEKKGLSVFEVHGTVDPMYCSNLCRLTMLWLENKVIFMDVEPFDFYVLTDFYNGRFRPLGYFSRVCVNQALI